MDVDFGRTADDYARHRAGFPDVFFDRLDAWGIGRTGQRILDLGTGTGTLARGFALRGADVTGLDPSAEMLARAGDLDIAAGVEVAYVAAAAEATGLPAGGFDVVTAGQCWHWFDRPRAAAETRRLLRPGGRLAIGHFDWLPLDGNVVAATEALIVKHNPAWTMGGGAGIYPQWFTDVRAAGFRDVEGFALDVGALYSHADWRGRIRASAGIAASLDADGVARFDAELAAMLAADFPGDPLTVPHALSAVIAANP